MARRTRTVYVGTVLLALLGFATSQLLLVKPPVAGASYSGEASLEQLHPYLHYLHSFSDRRRANIYFENTQPIFYGAQVNNVNVGLGNLTFARRDLVTTGRMPVVITRVYDSAGAGSIEFGPGWQLSAAERIEVGEGTARLFTESGAALDFVASGQDFVPAVDAPSDYSKLSRSSETVITTTLRTGVTKEFTLIGGSYRLTLVRDANGNQAQLSYTGNLLSRIQNASHYVDVTRDAQGRVTLVRDDLGRSVGYGYDDKGMLTQVTDLGGNVWSYQYTGQNQLHRAVDPAGRENFKVWYMSDGRVNAIDLPSGRISYVYDDSAHSATVTDRKSLVSQYFQNAEGITTRVINALGEETSIGLDGGRNVTELRRNGVLAEQMQYGADHRLTGRHSFGPSGETAVQYAYDAATGHVTRIVYGNGQVREFSYDGQGNVTRVSDVNGVQQFGYSPVRDLQSLSSPVTNLQLGYNAEGLVSQFTDSGGTASLQYAAGRLSQISFADGAWARMQYNALGLRKKLEYSNGSSIGYTYDPAGNLTGTAVVKADGSRDGETLTVDDSYQVTRQLLADGTEVLFGYDKNGNLTDVTAGSSVTRFEYDALNRLTAVVTDAGQRLEYGYEPGERSIVDEYDSGELSGSERQDSGLTFAAQWEVFANRSESSQWGTVRFSEKLGGFLLSGADGKEVVTPESRILAALGNLRLTDEQGMPLRSRLGTFNRPANLFFLPGEYATINCCVECPIGHGFFEGDPCDPCDPLGSGPTVSSITPSQGGVGEIVSVTISGSGFVQGASVDAGDKITVAGVVVVSGTRINATFSIAEDAALGDRDVTVDGSNPKTFRVTPAVQIEGNNYVFVGTDPAFSSANKYCATTTTPGGGTLSAASSNASDTFTTSSIAGAPCISVRTTTQSTANLDRTLTLKYTVSSVDSAPQVLKVTARQFAYATNAPTPPSGNTCSLGYGYRYDPVYTPYTHPDHAAAQPSIGLQGTIVTESFSPATISCNLNTGNASLDGNSQFSDRLEVCSTQPIPACSSTHTQTLKVAGYLVRTNSLTITNTALTYANQGPTQ